MRNKEQRNNLYERAMDLWGTDSQSKMIIEELAELIVAIRHYDRKKIKKIGLISELADVYIMLEQLKILAGIKQIDVNCIKEDKLTRLECLITEGEDRNV